MVLRNLCSVNFKLLIMVLEMWKQEEIFNLFLANMGKVNEGKSDGKHTK